MGRLAEKFSWLPFKVLISVVSCAVLTSQESHRAESHRPDAAFLVSKLYRPGANIKFYDSTAKLTCKYFAFDEKQNLGISMIRRSEDSNPRRFKLRARALYFKDERYAEGFQDMPVELIKKGQGTRQLKRIPEQEPIERPAESIPGIGESYWMEYTMRVACDVCQKKEDPAKPLQDLERAYLDGMMSAEEFEKQKQIAIKDFWVSLVSDGSVKRSIQTKSINLQVAIHNYVHFFLSTLIGYAGDEQPSIH
jgi:hypothetical protein